MTLRVVPEKGQGDVNSEKIPRNLDKKVTGRPAVEVEKVERIELSDRGKASFVDQRMPGVSLTPDRTKEARDA